MAKE
ncbi:hypothetical protein YPPY36_3365, partial [Yersinia pestis PY-36]|jgi:hypothetical protein